MLIGHPEDIIRIIKQGVDTFDCTVPTHYGRHGVAYFAWATDFKNNLLKDRKPLDPKCACEVCQSYSRSYLSHLIRAREMTGSTLLSMHNLVYFHGLVSAARKMIKQGKLGTRDEATPTGHVTGDCRRGDSHDKRCRLARG